MAKFSLRRVDNQAQASIVLSILSILPLVALLGFVFHRIDAKEFILYYGGKSRAAVFACAGASMLLAAIGFGLGLNSAGARRNDRQQLSWIGFFTGAIVLALTFVALFLFMTRGEAVIR